MQREQWGSRFGFIMAAAGSAIGLGNIWKFPYLAGTEGGGAFLVLYIVIMATFGVALMMTELAIGRASKLNPVGAFRKMGGKKWMPVGILGVITALMILSFYSVVGGWTIAYILKSIMGSTSSLSGPLLEEQFNNLVGSPIEPLLYHGIFMVLTVGIVLAGVTQGIEKSVKILMPLLFVILILLVFRSITLPGAREGITFFLMPKWEQINQGMVIAAFGQAFFSLSLGMGAMITYGSYLDNKTDIRSAAYWVVFLDCVVAFLAGLLVLPAVFAFGFNPGAGPGLIFITLPAVFSNMWGGYIFQIIFFAMLLIAALTSSISILSIPVAYFSETFGVTRKWSATIIGLLIFLVGCVCSLSLGIWGNVALFDKSFFDLMVYAVDTYMLPIGGIFTALFAGWVAYNTMAKQLTNDGENPYKFLEAWKWMIRIISPLAILWVLYKSLV
ncbi:sodium-dependent transporter [Flexibacterium corallicola]|uniref:sodium-dependent transporter n=1 Tax=Flexibacterium corallicola TaxID=3037259 RepID=UPI00286F0598|nr:sodium-dependent transporter [Pseudovibrio sp. M1P-2-3]